MSGFFISRPIFAWVLAIVVMLAGCIAIFSLPVAQYPAVAPPAISITATYPGASAQTVASTVVQVIEQQLSGLDHLLYFSSDSSKNGTATITLSFAQGTDPDIAQVQVQNKLQLATPLLPIVVQEQGITVAKSTKNFLIVLGLVSTDGKLTSTDVSDLIASSVQDPISRTLGVGDVQLLGAQYGMRIWLDPAKLNNFALTAGDVITAIEAQNVQVAAGELGGLPARQGQELNATIIGPSYLEQPAEFANILLRVQSSGAPVRIRDVGRVELEGENYNISAAYDGKPAAALAIKLASGANALKTVGLVKAEMATLQAGFPAGVKVIYPYDTSPFVQLSIHDVVVTLFVAIGLVFLVMLLFLQNVRATLVPTLAVPVVLLGTCAVLFMIGYSINSLTMFAMVLAIGLLVDDAIVVVENVERVMAEDKLSPVDAARKSMEQISGALIGIALVLTTVFLPMAFFGGSTGVIYRQFSITIVTAMVLSVAVALIFTPALCATLLRAPRADADEHKGFFGWFNRGYDRTSKSYRRGVLGMIKRPLVSMLVFGAIVIVMAGIYLRIPSGFLPDEDQGVMFVQVTAPPGAVSSRTQAVLDDAVKFLRDDPAVANVFAVNGFSYGGYGQNVGLAFVHLKPWGDRPGAANRVSAVAARAKAHFATIKDAMVVAFAPPAVLELGNATGFDFELLDRGGVGHAKLMAARNQLLGMAAKDKRLVGVRPNGEDDEPQYHVTIDREKAGALGLSIADINTTLSAAWGSSYVDQFLDRGRIKRVYVQGDVDSRMLPDELDAWYVRNTSGTMVPFTAFATGSWTTGSPQLERYDGIPSVELLGVPAPGQSTGTAIAAMGELAEKLPPGIGYDWTGLSYEERVAGNEALYLYALSLLIVFLCLAALYESWAIPASVLLVVPLGIIGAVMATWLRGLDNDVYFQVGLLTTVGLASKNAILIVEFAKAGHEAGHNLTTAALAAAKQRLRPILMTSIAFTVGVLPLAISTGAGSGGQNAIGTGVVGGMVSATLLAVFFVPVFFVVVMRLAEGKPVAPAVPAGAQPAAGE